MNRAGNFSPGLWLLRSRFFSELPPSAFCARTLRLMRPPLTGTVVARRPKGPMEGVLVGAKEGPARQWAPGW